MKIRLIYISVIAIILAAMLPERAGAQFRDNNNAAGTMKSALDNITDTTEYEVDSTYRRFTIGRFFKGLKHEDTLTISNVFFPAMILPGTGQIYNGDYWKLPIVYGTLGGCIGGAALFNKKWKKDGKSSDKNIFFSSLVPGLGQAYNGDYWHIPIYYGGFMISGYCWAFNQKQYKRYRKIYREIGEGTYTGHVTAENAVWFRDYYRRNRDYSVLATTLIYILNVIDANVFAHFAHFDISDDITFNVQPAVITPEMPQTGLYTYNPTYNSAKLGFAMDITF